MACKTFTQSGRDKPGDLREAIGGHALVRVLDIRIDEAIEHHVAVFREVDRTRRQARDHVFVT